MCSMFQGQAKIASEIKCASVLISSSTSSNRGQINIGQCIYIHTYTCMCVHICTLGIGRIEQMHRQDKSSQENKRAAKPNTQHQSRRSQAIHKPQINK